MARGAPLCAFHQTEVQGNPSYELVRKTKKFLFIGSRQSFHFHNKKCIKAWIEHGESVKSQDPEASE